MTGAEQVPGAAPLLNTKLYLPRIRTPQVARPRLLLLLDQSRVARLTLICAPGGFGKTALVSEWCEARGQDVPLGWVSLSEAENDPVLFWAYVAAALDRVHPGTGDGLRAALRPSEAGPPDAAWMACAQAVSELPSDFLLALDDYHVIDNPALNRALALLLDHMPPQMHLVLISRADPPLPLARLRAAGELVEVRAEDLRFTPAEAAAFLNELKELGLSESQLAALAERTEGWVAGLQMAALSMQGRSDLDSFIAAFTGSHRFIVDYLGEEVIQRQPQDVQQFLMETAILERLTGPLCDAVTGRDGSQAMLHRLEQANLFITQLDDQREWYRYHHLFADVLLATLRERDPDGERALHRRAAAWYEAHGQTADAVQHALAAGDAEAAAGLVEQSMETMLKQGELKSVQKWLEALPRPLLAARPSLAVACAEWLVLEGRFEAADGLLADAEATAAGEGFRGQIMAIRVLACRVRREQERAVMLAGEALRLLPADDRRWRGRVLLWLGGAHQQVGEVALAAEPFAEAVALSRHAGDLYTAALATCLQGSLQLYQGNAQAALALYHQALRFCGDEGESAAAAVHMNLALLYRRRSELDAAERHAAETLRLAMRGGHLEPLLYAHVLLAFHAAVKGEHDRAEELLRKGAALAPAGVGWLGRVMAALRTQVWLVQGRFADAADWARAVAPQVTDELYSPMAFELVTLIWAQIATGQVSAALARLDEVLPAAEAAANQLWLGDLRALRALGLFVSGESTGAVAVLELALESAEATTMVHVFTERGEAMVRLLRAALPHSSRAGVIRRLLGAMGGTPAPGDGRVAPGVQPLAEPLSERELDVLRLVAEGASNQEIGVRLFIAVTTVKKHISNIFGKLAVENRIQALSRAQELGLL